MSDIAKEIRELRARVAQELRDKRNLFRKNGYKMESAKDFNDMIVGFVIDKYDGFNLTKPTINNIEDLVEDALECVIASRCAKCPPLPCGADDSWYEGNTLWQEETKERFDGLLTLYIKMLRDLKHQPNIHAFDESYFGED